MDVEREERRGGAEILTWCTMGFSSPFPPFNPIREGKSATTRSGLDFRARSIVTTVEIVEKHKNSPSEILFLGRRAEDHRVGLFVIALACPKVVRLYRTYLRNRTVV